LYQYDIWHMSFCIDDRLVCRFGWDCISSKPAHQTVIYTEWHMPDVVLIQLILLMMGTWLPETCRDRNKHTWKENCVSSWLFTKMCRYLTTKLLFVPQGAIILLFACLRTSECHTFLFVVIFKLYFSYWFTAWFVMVCFIVLKVSTV
jgi:hypothetical protein